MGASEWGKTPNALKGKRYGERRRRRRRSEHRRIWLVSYAAYIWFVENVDNGLHMQVLISDER
jgi:hypothetical protein